MPATKICFVGVFGFSSKIYLYEHASRIKGGTQSSIPTVIEFGGDDGP